MAVEQAALCGNKSVYYIIRTGAQDTSDMILVANLQNKTEEKTQIK